MDKNNQELQSSKMVTKKTWNEFRATGLLWFANMILHTFGWAIVVEIADNGNEIKAYPARVKFRGFDNKSISESYLKISKYLSDNHEELLKEASE